MPKLFFLGHSFHLCAGVGDGNEIVAGFVAFFFAELHGDGSERPVWKRRFSADALLCTME